MRPLLLVLLAVAPFVTGAANQLAGDDVYLLGTRLEAARSPFRFFAEDYWAPIETGLYRPVGLSILWMEHAAFGDAWWMYRLVSLVCHLVTVLALWRLARQRVGDDAAWGAAALFACHPVHAEAILFVYGQLDLIAAGGVIGALLLFGRQRPFAAAFVLLASMLVKESALIAPLLTAWWFRDGKPAGWRRPTVCSALAAGFALLLKLAVLHRLAVPAAGTVTGGAIGTLLWGKAVIVAAAHGVRLLVAPAGQTIYYGHLRDSLIGWPVIELAWLAAAGLGLVVLLRRHRDRAHMATALGWLCFCWLPVSNLIPTGILVAERALYLPSAGAALAGGFAGVRHRRAFAATLALACATSLMVTRGWRSEESLWSKTVADHPRSPRAHAALGLARLKGADTPGEQTLSSAASSFQQALALNPRAADALFGNGLVELHRGHPRAALSWLQAAVTQRPSDTEMRAALARCEDALSPGEIH